MDSNLPESPDTRPYPPPDASAALLASLIDRVTDLEHQLALLQDALQQDALQQDALQLYRLPQNDSPASPRTSPFQSPPPPPHPLGPPLAPLIENEYLAPHSRPKTASSLENRLGSQVFNRIGIVALLFATSWGLKLAIEEGWLGPIARILIGLGVGTGVVVWSERFRRKGFAPFSHSLKAVGTGILYLSLWAAFQLYHLLPAYAALGAMILVSAWNALMAWSQDSELLAAYALTGAFLTPVLLSTGGNHEIFLFTYISAVDIATLLLVRLKPWPRLLLATLAGTISFYIGWYSRFYPELGRVSPYPAPYQLPAQPFALTIAFTLLFFAIFVLPTIRTFLRWPTPYALPPIPSHDPQPVSFPPPDAFPVRPYSVLILDIPLPLSNAAFGSLAFYSLLQDSLRHDLLPWLMVAFAAAYLGLMRFQRTSLSIALHLALAITFLTIAIPFKASGHSLTIAWLVEGLALLWVSTRFASSSNSAPVPELLTPASVLRFLSFAGYTLGFLALFIHYRIDEYVSQTLLSADFIAALVGIAVFAGAAHLGLHAVLTNPAPPVAWLPVAWSNFLALYFIAMLLVAREIASSDRLRLELPAHHPAFDNPDFFTALTGITTLAAVTYILARLIRIPALTPLKLIAALAFVLFNLATILTIEREVSALWPYSTANLQRSLAISGFLMLYGTALLTLGFLKRNAFTRWQALILLLFTVAKVFLYDMSTLSQGYRVASVLGLGIVLMTVSFAYQKDWLALRTPEPIEHV